MTHVDVSSFALKSNLASLITEVDKLDIDKLAPISTDFAKLSNVVKNDVVKKTVYDKLFSLGWHTWYYLVFQLMHKYLKTVTPNSKIKEISSWEFKGLSNEKISSIITSDYSLALNLIYRNA